jgi:hypothetical protein
MMNCSIPDSLRDGLGWLLAVLAVVTLLVSPVLAGPADEELAVYTDQRFGFSVSYPVSWRVTFSDAPSTLLDQVANHVTGGKRLELLPVGLDHLVLATLAVRPGDRAAETMTSCEIAYRPAASTATFPQFVSLYAKWLNALTPFASWDTSLVERQSAVAMVEYPILNPDGTAVYHAEALIETHSQLGLFVVACGGATLPEKVRLKQRVQQMAESFQQGDAQRIATSR